MSADRRTRRFGKFATLAVAGRHSVPWRSRRPRLTRRSISVGISGMASVSALARRHRRIPHARTTDGHIIRTLAGLDVFWRRSKNAPLCKG